MFLFFIVGLCLREAAKGQTGTAKGEKAQEEGAQPPEDGDCPDEICPKDGGDEVDENL
jgi:hypothetical protein